HKTSNIIFKYFNFFKNHKLIDCCQYGDKIYVLMNYKTEVLVGKISGDKFTCVKYLELDYAKSYGIDVIDNCFIVLAKNAIYKFNQKFQQISMIRYDILNCFNCKVSGLQKVGDYLYFKLSDRSEFGCCYDYICKIDNELILKI